MLTVVACFFNNRREAPNTLHSLTPGYQKGIDGLEYEVIAVDNGSESPLDEAMVRGFGANFHYRFVATASKSPAAAINQAVREAGGERVMVLIDGAHLLSPGILRLTEDAFRLFPAPFVATGALHLGPKRQNMSVAEGYDQREEDRLLAMSGWKRDGYRLYLVSRAFADGGAAWFGKAFESGCFAMPRRDYLAMGGFDERFQLPGGGLVNLDFFSRALDNTALEYVMLLGEATFHQFHGGVSTNKPMGEHPFVAFHGEYERLTGKPLARTSRRPYFMGRVPDECLHFMYSSAKFGLPDWIKSLPFRGDLLGPPPRSEGSA